MCLHYSADMIEIVIPLAAFAFVSSITPGPNNLMLMASGTNFGVRRTIPHIAGVCVGFGLMIAIVGTGLARVFELWPVTLTVLKLASAAYLAYLAWKIANAGGPVEKSADQTSTGKPFTFLQAAAFQWVNPKAWVMALSAISLFTVAGWEWASLALIVVVFCVINLPCILSWTLLGTQMRRFLSTPRRLRAFNIGAAGLLLATLVPVFLSSGLGH
ncbi:MAG: LysE family translocator [Hyphomonadaceae bacterium]|nr:LysE family translocator [Hyphomonadaceae bacterium]